jgi:hypothetical protein
VPAGPTPVVVSGAARHLQALQLHQVVPHSLLCCTTTTLSVRQVAGSCQRHFPCCAAELPVIHNPTAVLSAAVYAVHPAAGG